MLTKKHYKEIAYIISDCTTFDFDIDRDKLIKKLSRFLKADNLRFDSVKFKEACNPSVLKG